MARVMARLGLGLAALGRPGYLNIGHGAELGEDRSVATLRARTFEVLDFAYAAGDPRLRRRPLLRPRRGVPRGLVAHPQPPRGDGELQVGLRLHRRLGGRARPARGQAPRSRDLPPSAGRDAREPGGVARALPDPLGDAGERRAAQRRAADGAAGDRPAARRLRVGRLAGRDDRRRAGDRALRRRPGDLEPARASGRRGARARFGRRPEGDGQGGAGQRAARGGRRRRARCRARAAVGDGGLERCRLGRGAALEPARPGSRAARARSTSTSRTARPTGSAAPRWTGTSPRRRNRDTESRFLRLRSRTVGQDPLAQRVAAAGGDRAGGALLGQLDAV